MATLKIKNEHGEWEYVGVVGYDVVSEVEGKLSRSADVLETYTEKVVTVGDTAIINLNEGNVFVDTPNSNRMYSIANAKGGAAHSFTLQINMNTARTLTFPDSVKWQGEEIPDMSNDNKTYVLTFVSVDGGSTWLGMFGGEF